MNNPFENSKLLLDKLIGNLESDLNVPPSQINPDDFWQSKLGDKFGLGNRIYTLPCKSDVCSYRMTSPFEKRCPLCDFKNSDKVPFSLPKPVFEKKKSSGNKSDNNKKNNNNNNNNTNNNKKNNNNNNKNKKNKKKGGGNNNQPTSWQKAKLCVGKIVECQCHPESDKLLIISLDVGEENPRPVCAGLQKFYKPEDLKETLVCANINLKAAKLGGYTSSAMVMAAESGDSVCILTPPSNSKPGDRLFLEGETPYEKTPKTLRSTFWNQIKEEFKVKENKATYQGKVVVTENGPVTVENIPDDAQIK